MKNYWVIGAFVLVVYLLSIGFATYYFSVPSMAEKEAVKVKANVVDATPISEELMQEISDRVQYGDQPIMIDSARIGKYNPFRI